MVSKSETPNHNRHLACALSTRAADREGDEVERASSHSLKGRAPVTRVGLEAGPLSRWLHAGLVRPGFEAVLLETRPVEAVLSSMSTKTDRNDARGIAALVRMGWFRVVHAKSVGSREVRRYSSRASRYFQSLWIPRI